MRVLIVDDEPIIRQVIRRVLTRRGHEAVEAESGLQALEMAHQTLFDLVITDQVMPGITGLELISRLRTEHYPARYLLTSGYRLVEEPVDVPFLPKPFTVSRLVEALEAFAVEPTLPELEQDWRRAKAEWFEAITEMDAIIKEVPCSLPSPDGALQIQRVGQKRKAAYEKYMAAFRKSNQARKKRR